MRIMNLFILPYIVFVLSFLGILLNRSNIILILLCIELMLLSISLNVLIPCYFQLSLINQITSIYIITIAAVESAIGLAIIISFYKLKGSISVKYLNMLKG